MKFIVLMLALVAVRCASQEEATVKIRLPAQVAAATASSEGTDVTDDMQTLTDSESEAGVESELRDPAKITADIEKKVIIAPNGLSPNQDLYKSPKVKINKGNSDYVQLARCAGSYVIRTSTGERLDEIKGRPDEFGLRRYAWKTVLAEYHKCWVISEKMSYSEYIDIAAKTGTYYYIINPCIDKEKSKSRRDHCSFDLKVSDPITFKNQLLEDIQAKSIELAKASADLEARIGEISKWAKLFELRLRACENKIAHDNAITSFYRGLFVLGTFITGAAIGSIMGPNAAQMSGMMAMQVGQKVARSRLGLVEQGNTCATGPKDITPELAAKGGGKSYEKLLSDATDLENMFHTVQASTAIEDLSKSDPKHESDSEAPLDGDGIIYRARHRVVKLMNEMKKFDATIITAEEAIVQMKKDGVDPKDAEDIEKLFDKSG